MRVLHVDPERGWGGGEAQVLALAGAMAARGHDVRLAVDPAGGLAAAAAGLRTAPLRVRNHLDVAAGLRLRRLAAGCDVVHFHTARAHALAPFITRGRAWRVVTRRMDYVPAGGPYVRLLYNRAVDVVIAISEGVRAALLRAGVDAARIRLVPSGVDPAALASPPAARAALRAEWEVPPDAVLVLVLGALERRKGHAVLLAAAAAAPGLRYVFCGDGGEMAALRRAAAPLGGAVQFVGFRRDVAACLAAADVVALPSLQEGLGVAALEAMAAGRPVVASRVGGLGEVVLDGETGLLVPPGDAAALAAALARLGADPALRARLGAAGRARVLARYTVAQMAEGTLACYERAR
ncbi:MAG TPA: glycosyltransferase family 4 protein [Candidatus Binatia bacterium]|nr:glycosyltransferase family 4 protein [Candidatus Binatia bacterium]